MFDSIVTGVEQRIRARPWLDHLVRAAARYRRQRGDYYAAGITYFTVLSVFPLLMVAFAVAGVFLSSNPDLLLTLQDKIVEISPGSFGEQVTDLVDRAVASRGTVGVLGLLVGLYTGLGWMSNLRAALTEQWEQKTPARPLWRTKLSDLGALIGLGLAFVVSLGLSALASSALGPQVLAGLDLVHLPGAELLLTAGSILLGLVASWAVFAWIIARLPREPVTLASAAKAGALAAPVFEVFKIVASIYLQWVSSSPAGVAFGSIIGFMVFTYTTYRITLFATAWAATAVENEPDTELPAPAPAVIAPRVGVHDASWGVGAVLFGLGALVALGLSRLRRLR